MNTFEQKINELNAERVDNIKNIQFLESELSALESQTGGDVNAVLVRIHRKNELNQALAHYRTAQKTIGQTLADVQRQAKSHREQTQRQRGFLERQIAHVKGELKREFLPDATRATLEKTLIDIENQRAQIPA